MEEKGEMTETKLQKYQRLAPKRSAAAAKQIDLLANLGASGYDTDPEIAAEWIVKLHKGLMRVAIAWGQPALDALRPEAERAFQPAGRVTGRPAAREALQKLGAQLNGADLTSAGEEIGEAANAARVAVEGRDRTDIRRALSLIQDGRAQDGEELLVKIVLGWAPERWESLEKTG